MSPEIEPNSAIKPKSWLHKFFLYMQAKREFYRKEYPHWYWIFWCFFIFICLIVHHYFDSWLNGIKFILVWGWIMRIAGYVVICVVPLILLILDYIRNKKNGSMMPWETWAMFSLIGFLFLHQEIVTILYKQASSSVFICNMETVGWTDDDRNLLELAFTDHNYAKIKKTEQAVRFSEASYVRYFQLAQTHPECRLRAAQEAEALLTYYQALNRDDDSNLAYDSQHEILSFPTKFPFDISSPKLKQANILYGRLSKTTN